MATEPLQNPQDCPIQEDPHFQEWTWRVERLGWILMAAVVLAAAFGLFGGPNARTAADDSSGRLHVSYQKFQRHLAPSEVMITVEAQNDPILDLVVDEQLAEAFEIRTVSPQPLESLAHERGVLLRFAVSGENKEPVRIVFMGVPGKLGRIAGGVGLLGTAPAPVRILVYP